MINKRTGKCRDVFAIADDPIHGKKIIILTYAEYKRAKARARREGWGKKFVPQKKS